MLVMVEDTEAGGSIAVPAAGGASGRPLNRIGRNALLRLRSDHAPITVGVQWERSGNALPFSAEGMMLHAVTIAAQSR